MAVPADTQYSLTPLPASLLKRRAVKFTASAAAMTLTGTLAGCSMFGAQATGPKPTFILEPDPRPVTLAPTPAPNPQQKQLAKQVEEFAANVDAALNPKPASAATAPAAAAAAPAPAVTVTSAEPASRVILASANSHAGETPKTSSPLNATATPVSNQTVPSAVITPLKTPTEKITPTAMTAALASPTASSDTTISPSAVTEVGEPTVDQAIAVLRKSFATKPTMNTTLAMALIDAAQGKTPEAAPAAFSDADQKVLADLISALTSMNTTTGNVGVADRTAPLVVAAKKWEGEADLQLPKLLLASRVDSYGVYSAIDPKFEAGKRHTVIIYCEVANFSSKTDADGWHQTRLSQQETLITEDGLLVWRPNAEEVDDRSLNQRRDFYLVKKLTIPENLAAGKYTLRMNVSDKNSGKIAMVNLPIEIVGR